jgi:hypothetical protein
VSILETEMAGGLETCLKCFDFPVYFFNEYIVRGFYSPPKPCSSKLIDNLPFIIMGR